MDEIADESEKLSSAAAAAKARREARIKRILGNSKNRLSKITGREEEEEENANDAAEIRSKKESDGIIYPDPEIERDVYEFEPPFIPMGIPEPDVDIFQLLNNLKQSQPTGQSSSATAPQQTPYASKMTKFLRTKIHFAALAVLTYAMVATDTLVTRNIFLMFLLWEAAEVFLLKTYEVNKTGFISILFMLGGIPAIHSTAIIKFMETAVKILNDVAVFVFYFVASHILWKMFVMGSTFDSITNFEAI